MPYKTPAREERSLDRYECDRIARSLLGEAVRLTPRLARIRKMALHEAGPLLRLAGLNVETSRRTTGGVRDLPTRQVLERVSKLLPGLIL